MSESNEKKKTFHQHNAAAAEDVLRYLRSNYVDGDTEARKTIICETVPPADRVVTQESIHHLMNHIMRYQATALDEAHAFLTVHMDDITPEKRTPSDDTAAPKEGKGKRKRSKTPPSGGEQS